MYGQARMTEGNIVERKADWKSVADDWQGNFQQDPNK